MSKHDADPPRQDTQHQVEHKEGADDDERDEVDPVPHGTQGVVGLEKKTTRRSSVVAACHDGSKLSTCAHVVEDGRPSLHGDALENGEHGKQDVVELRDAVVGADPGVVALITDRAPPHAAGERQLGRVHCLVFLKTGIMKIFFLRFFGE